MDLAYTTSSLFWPSEFQRHDRTETLQYYDVMTGQWVWPRVFTMAQKVPHNKEQDFEMDERRNTNNGLALRGENIQGALTNWKAPKEILGVERITNGIPSKPSQGYTCLVERSSNCGYPSDIDIGNFIGNRHLVKTSDPSPLEKVEENEKRVLHANLKDTPQLSETEPRFKPTRDVKGRFIRNASDKTISTEPLPRGTSRSQIGENPFACPECSKRFSYASNLKRHLRSHSGEKPYVCKECKKMFADPSNLGKHLRTHSSSDKPYNCEKSGKAFTDTANMNNYLLENSYECTECNMIFSDVKKLNKHQQVHRSSEGAYVCLQCNKTFSQASSLRHHLDEKHARGTVIQRA